MSRKQEDQARDGVSARPEVIRDAGKSGGSHWARWKNGGNIPCDRFYSKEQCSE